MSASTPTIDLCYRKCAGVACCLGQVNLRFLNVAHFLWRTYKITCFQLLHTPYTFIYAVGHEIMEMLCPFTLFVCIYVPVVWCFFLSSHAFPTQCSNTVTIQAPTPACSHIPTHFTFSFIWLFLFLCSITRGTQQICSFECVAPYWPRWRKDSLLRDPEPF